MLWKRTQPQSNNCPGKILEGIPLQIDTDSKHTENKQCFSHIIEYLLLEEGLHIVSVGSITVTTPISKETLRPLQDWKCTILFSSYRVQAQWTSYLLTGKKGDTFSKTRSVSKILRPVRCSGHTGMYLWYFKLGPKTALKSTPPCCLSVSRREKENPKWAIS